MFYKVLTIAALPLLHATAATFLYL